MKKLIISLALIFGATSQSFADATAYVAMDMAMKNINEREKREQQYIDEKSKTIDLLDSYLQIALKIQSAVTQYNSKPYFAGERSINFYDLTHYRVLSINPGIMENVDRREHTNLKFNGISITLKTNENHKVNLLLENVSNDQCKNLVYSFKINSVKEIILNAKSSDEKNVCLDKNSIEVINY